VIASQSPGALVFFNNEELVFLQQPQERESRCQLLSIQKPARVAVTAWRRAPWTPSRFRTTRPSWMPRLAATAAPASTCVPPSRFPSRNPGHLVFGCARPAGRGKKVSFQHLETVGCVQPAVFYCSSATRLETSAKEGENERVRKRLSDDGNFSALPIARLALSPGGDFCKRSQGRPLRDARCVNGRHCFRRLDSSR
jgi:hypothetical protein